MGEKSDVSAYYRKVFHATGLVIVAIYWWTPVERTPLAIGLATIALLLGVFDLIRARSPRLQEQFLGVFRLIVADKDRKGWNGSTLYFAGCAITVALFAKPSACAGILCLALGDSLAAVVGMSVNSPRWGNISLAGSLTCLTVCTLTCRMFVDWPHALLGGVTATLLEGIAGTKLDNLLIPVGTAGILALIA